MNGCKLFTGVTPDYATKGEVSIGTDGGKRGTIVPYFVMFGALLVIGRIAYKAWNHQQSELKSVNEAGKSMQIVKAGKSREEVYIFRLQPGDDLKRQLEDFIKQTDLQAAYVKSCVGSVSSAYIRHANKEEGTLWVGEREIVSLVGTLSSVSGSHLHISLSDGNGQVIGGHLLSSKEGEFVDGNPKKTSIYTTAELVIGVAIDLTFKREPCNLSGYPELVVYPRD